MRQTLRRKSSKTHWGSNWQSYNESTSPCFKKLLKNYQYVEMWYVK